MLDQHRDWFKGPEILVGKIFSRLPLSPNHYTALAVCFIAACLYVLIGSHYVWAILFFIAASFLDFIDGAVARKKGLETKAGAYLDTIADRYVEAILLLGFLLLPLPDFFFPAGVWIFLVLFGSTMTT
jgi:phosphatidylglycerophosphate synthase